MKNKQIQNITTTIILLHIVIDTKVSQKYTNYSHVLKDTIYKKKEVNVDVFQRVIVRFFLEKKES